MKEKLKERLEKEFNRKQEIFIDVAMTDAGVDVFRYLRDICSFEESGINMNPVSGEISGRNTIYNCARRSVYLEIRKYLPKKLLAKIELGDKK